MKSALTPKPVNLLFLEETKAAAKKIIREHQIEKLRIADGADTSGRDEKVRRNASRPVRKGLLNRGSLCMWTGTNAPCAINAWTFVLRRPWNRWGWR